MELNAYSREDLVRIEGCIYKTAQCLYTICGKELGLFGGFLLKCQTAVKVELIRRDRGEAA